MTRSIISPKRRQLLFRALAVLFWVLVWEALSRIIRQEVLLASPLAVFRTLVSLLGERSFYQSLANTLLRIMAGFGLALSMGVALAALAYASGLLRTLLEPVMTVIKATPVASFIILALIWVSPMNLSVLACFLMVLPIIYSNALAGLRNADPKLLEMARVFRLSRAKRTRAILIPSAFPYLLSACEAAFGICWKAGIAAEVIGQPNLTVGDALYRSKIFLSTKEMFAWTVVVIVISVLLEKLVLRVIRLIQQRMEGA